MSKSKYKFIYIYKKFFLILLYLLIILVFYVMLKNALRDHKYTIRNFDELIKYNCSLIMNVENKVYSYDNVEFFKVDYSSDNIIATNEIEVTNNEIKYCNYAITKEQDYIFTYIDRKRSIFKIQAPLSEEFRTFLLNSFLKDGVNYITVWPFKNTNKLCVRAGRGYYFVDLLSKNIKLLDHGRFGIAEMNLKENVMTIVKIDALTNYTYVFDENGEFICKFL